MWLVVLAMYSTLPVIDWIVKGTQYPDYYGRMATIAPSPQEHQYLLTITIAYAFSFILFHYLAYGRLSSSTRWSPPPIPRNVLIFSAILAFGGPAFDLFLRYSGILREAASYGDEYLAIAELPIEIRQLLKIASAMGNFGMGVVLVALMRNIRKTKWLLILYLAIMVGSYDVSGGRSALVIAIFRCVVCWHVIVRPISNKSIFAGGVSGLVLFNFLGYYRGVLEGADTQFGMGVGEFLNLWGNALELARYADVGSLNILPSVRFGELYSFIPSQLVPEKQSLDEWFVQTFYPEYYKNGGGLAFGIISQAIVGGGIPEALTRGAILGWVFAKISKNFGAKRDAKWWYFPVQLYLLVNVYYSVRSTTFAFIGGVVQVLIPAIIILTIVDRVRLRARPRIERDFGPVKKHIHRYTDERNVLVQ